MVPPPCLVCFAPANACALRRSTHLPAAAPAVPAARCASPRASPWRWPWALARCWRLTAAWLQRGTGALVPPPWLAWLNLAGAAPPAAQPLLLLTSSRQPLALVPCRYFGDAAQPLVADSLAANSVFTSGRVPVHRLLAALVLVNSWTKVPGLLLVLQVGQAAGAGRPAAAAPTGPHVHRLTTLSSPWRLRLLPASLLPPSGHAAVGAAQQPQRRRAVPPARAGRGGAAGPAGRRHGAGAERVPRAGRHAEPAGRPGQHLLLLAAGAPRGLVGPMGGCWARAGSAC